MEKHAILLSCSLWYYIVSAINRLHLFHEHDLIAIKILYRNEEPQ